MSTRTKYCLRLTFGEKRARAQEDEIRLTSKVEYALTSFSLEKLQKAFHVSPGSTPDELQLGEYSRIFRNTPFAPNCPPLYGVDAGWYSGTQPLVAELKGIECGLPVEKLLPLVHRYPILSLMLNHFQATGLNSVYELAQQVSPALDVSLKWDDPSVRDVQNFWKEARIEYEQSRYALPNGQGCVHPVCDTDGFVRHLILNTPVGGKTVIVPLTFAQNLSFRQPQVCYFAFSPEWWLMGSEQLRSHPGADVWITNDLYCRGDRTESSPQSEIFLSYPFGKEMIPHLKLECLYQRNVKGLIIEDPDEQEKRRNVEEGILLMSRLKDMDIKAEFEIVANTAPPRNSLCFKSIFDERRESIEPPCDVGCPHGVNSDQIVDMAMSYGIEIPENLRHDRYGALACRKKKILVEDFLDSGAVTTVTVHHGVDLTLVTCGIVAGLDNGEIFPKKWSCRQKIHPVLFIKNNTGARHDAIFKKLSTDKLSCYEIPTGNCVAIKDRLYHIVKENGFDVFVFESRQIVQEYRKELQIVCEWAEKHDVETVMITTQEDRAAETFFSDICGRDIHFWWHEKHKNEYIVEDRPLLVGEAAAFKITFSGGAWTVQDHAEEELRLLKDRNIKILHEETENETIDRSSTPIVNYRGK